MIFQKLTIPDDKDGKLLKIKLYIIVCFLFLCVNSFFLGAHFDTFYYWSWGQHLALGYLDGPPLIAYCIRLFSFIFGNTLFALNSLGVFTTFCAAFFVFKIAKSLSDNHQIGLTAAFLWLFSNTTRSELLTRITYDNLEQVFWLATTFFILEYLRIKSNKSLYYASITFGFLLLSKYTGIILFLALFTFFIIHRKERIIFKNKHLYFAGLLTLFIFSPNLIWNIQHHWLTFDYQLHVHHRNPPTHWPLIWYYLKGIIKDQIYIAPLAIFLIYRHPHLKPNQICWQLLWHISFILFVFWLVMSYSTEVYHGYLQFLTVPLMIILAYYLILFCYQKTLRVLIVSLSLIWLTQIVSKDIRTQTRALDWQLLTQFSRIYSQQPATTPIIVGHDYALISQLLFINPKLTISTIPHNRLANQFRYWNLALQQQLITHQVRQAFYIDKLNRPYLMQSYFDHCTPWLSLEKKRADNQGELAHLFVYQCQNN